MTDQGGNRRSGPRGRAALKQIDLQLDGLLGRLGDTLGEMIERLEDGETGELRRSHEIQTSKGPVRAEAGLRVRMGLDGDSDRSGTESFAEPVRAPGARSSGSRTEGGRHRPGADGRNATGDGSGGTDRPGAPSAEPPADEGATPPRELRIDAYSAADRWVFSADMPGVSLPELTVGVEAGELVVRSAGRRRYAGRHPLPAGADPSDMDIALRNGVLEITMALSDQGGAA